MCDGPHWLMHLYIDVRAISWNSFCRQQQWQQRWAWGHTRTQTGKVLSHIRLYWNVFSHVSYLNGTTFSIHKSTLSHFKCGLEFVRFWFVIDDNIFIIYPKFRGYPVSSANFLQLIINHFGVVYRQFSFYCIDDCYVDRSEKKSYGTKLEEEEESLLPNHLNTHFSLYSVIKRKRPTSLDKTVMHGCVECVCQSHNLYTVNEFNGMEKHWGNNSINGYIHFFFFLSSAFHWNGTSLKRTANIVALPPNVLQQYSTLFNAMKNKLAFAALYGANGCGVSSNLQNNKSFRL